MISALLAIALTQAQPVLLTDPRNANKRVTTSDAGNRVGLDVMVMNPSSAGTGGTLDGGNARDQGLAADGGRDWSVQAKLVDGNGQPIGNPLQDGGLVHAIVDNTVGVTGPLTDTQLRASRPAVFVEFDGGLVHDSNLDVLLSTRTKPADQQHTILDSTGVVLAVGFDGGLVQQVPGSGQGGFVDGGSLAVVNLSDAGLAMDSTVASLLTFAEWQQRVATLGRKASVGSASVVLAWDQGPVPIYHPTPQAVTLAALPYPDGGSTIDITGSTVQLPLTTTVWVNVVTPPINPFLPRCNPVRRTGCQP